MKNHNQNGAANGLVIALVLSFLLLIGAVVFAVWAYSGRQNYKNNVDSKVNAAVSVAVSRESQLKDTQFAQAEKNPLVSYTGPQAYGSISVSYPKTWSGYVDTSGGNNLALDGYFNPGVVPSISSTSSVFALRVQIINQAYSQTLEALQQQTTGLTTSTYALPKLPKVVGVEVNGVLTNQGASNQTNETMVILPLRSETLEIWTDGSQYLSDFNQIVLPNFSFSP